MNANAFAAQTKRNIKLMKMTRYRKYLNIGIQAREINKLPQRSYDAIRDREEGHGYIIDTGHEDFDFTPHQWKKVRRVLKRHNIKYSKRMIK
jgi:hypothetical protein